MDNLKHIKKPFQNLILEEDGLYKKTDDGVDKICNRVWIDHIKINMDTGENLSRIGYSYIGGENFKEIPRDEYLNSQNLIKYQKYGMDVLQSNVRDIVLHLRNEEEVANKVFVHSKLGFNKYNNKETYNHYKSTKIDSTYIGSFEIKPKGCEERWIKMFEKEVINNTPLEFICMVGLSSVITAYIGEKVNMDSLIFHMVGNSTTGKTTAIKLAISMFGYPNAKKNGLFSTYNGTENGLLKQLEGVNGMPIAFDELSMSNSSNHSSFVYKVVNGTSKSRLNKDSQLQDKQSWTATILSNGEKSLIKSSNKNAGIQIRVFEVSNVQWTKSAKNAENINEVIMHNYGHIGSEFAEFIMNYGRDTLIEKYKKITNKLEKILIEKNISDTFTKRRVNKYAVIYLTALLFKKMSGKSLNINGMVEIFLNIEKESIKNRNFEKSAIEYINMFVELNKNKFDTAKASANSECWGRLKNKTDYVELEMNPIKFAKMLKEGGFEDENVVLKQLKDAGLLSCDKDRYTRKRKGDMGVKIPMIVVKLN